MNGRRRFVARAVAVAAVLSAVPVRADWTQLWGPHGDGRARSGVMLPDGAALKGRELWRRPIGGGFSGVTSTSGRVYTATSDGGSDHVVALDALTGDEAWRTRIGETYRGHDGSKDGPISTPALDGARLFIVGPRGLLLALDAARGRILWSHASRPNTGPPIRSTVSARLRSSPAVW